MMNSPVDDSWIQYISYPTQIISIIMAQLQVISTSRPRRRRGKKSKNNSIKTSNKVAVKKTDERSLLQKLGAMTLRGAGAGIGYAVGNPAMGYNTGAHVSRYLGLGKYTLAKNTLYQET